MAWDKGFNFRGSSGYVTDGTNETYVILSDTYPTTRNGVTFGWAVGNNMTPNDLDNTVDRRLAGRNYAQPGAPETFQVDLEAADSYTINIANGDTSGSGQSTQLIEVLDNTTSKFINNPASFGADTYNDATNVNRTEANWPSLNAAQTVAFSTATFKLRIGDVAASYTVMAHLFLSRATAASGLAPSSFNQFPKPLMRQPITAGRVM